MCLVSLCLRNQCSRFVVPLDIQTSITLLVYHSHVWISLLKFTSDSLQTFTPCHKFRLVNIIPVLNLRSKRIQDHYCKLIIGYCETLWTLVGPFKMKGTLLNVLHISTRFRLLSFGISVCRNVGENLL